MCDGKVVLHNSQSRDFQVYEIDNPYCLTVLLELNHSFRQSEWIDHIEPAHLQGVINGFSISSSSPRQILQIGKSELFSDFSSSAGSLTYRLSWVFSMS